MVKAIDRERGLGVAKRYGMSAEELLKSVEHSAGTAKPNEGSEKTV